MPGLIQTSMSKVPTLRWSTQRQNPAPYEFPDLRWENKNAQTAAGAQTPPPIAAGNQVPPPVAVADEVPPPSSPPLADGELKLDPTGAYYTPKGGITVEDRMSGLLNKDSSYMKSAMTGAGQIANQRGLLNSTMAASAGEDAAIKSALPIAQQDAGYYQNLGQQKNQGAVTSILQGEQGDISSRLQGEEGDIKSRIQAEQGAIQGGLYGIQGDISSRLQAEQGAMTSSLSAQNAAQETALRAAGYTQEQAMKILDATNASNLSAQGYTQEQSLRAAGFSHDEAMKIADALNASNLSAQQAEQDAALRAAGYTHEKALQEIDLSWKSMDLDARMQVEANRLTQENKAMFETSTKAIADDYAKDFLAILVDPAFTAAGRTNALNSLKVNTQSRYDLAAAIAGYTLTWTPAEVSSTV